MQLCGQRFGRGGVDASVVDEDIQTVVVGGHVSEGGGDRIRRGNVERDG